MRVASRSTHGRTFDTIASRGALLVAIAAEVVFILTLLG